MHRIPLALFAALALYAADVNTFSIVDWDPSTGDCGVTVASRYSSVGAVVPWVEEIITPPAGVKYGNLLHDLVPMVTIAYQMPVHHE
jgi:hypothetical protein